MPRTRSSIEKIRAELTWVNQPLDPNKCSCRHMRCCEETNHVAGACTRSVETTVWTYRLEYFCSACRKYEWEAGRCLAQDSAQLTMARLSTEKVQGLKKVFTENAVVPGQAAAHAGMTYAT